MEKYDDAPIYTDKVNYILNGLKKGKSRADLAEELNYSSYKSMDTMIRRKNFIWDSDEYMYVPKNGQNAKEFVPGSAKAELVINLFREHDDPKKVAKEAGFKDHLQLAQHMKDEGYQWSRKEGNYVEVEEDDAKEKKKTVRQGPGLHETTILQLGKYLPLLKYLEENEEKIKELIDNDDEISGKEPNTYSLKGTSKTKNIYMSRLAIQKLEDFANKHRLSQRQVVEAALVEYFRKNASEIGSILNGS